ncbi:MAG TPA: helix-turn-helix domain-containing protein [Acidimicrobiia bacterium]
MTNLMAIQIHYDLSPVLAKILLLLAQNKVVTSRMIEVDESLTKDAKVALHRLRRRLEGPGIEIKSRRDVGYWIETESRMEILEVLADGQMELPLGDGGNDAS